MAETAGHRYGTIEVGGNATAQLGNTTRVEKSYHFGHVDTVQILSCGFHPTASEFGAIVECEERQDGQHRRCLDLAGDRQEVSGCRTKNSEVDMANNVFYPAEALEAIDPLSSTPSREHFGIQAVDLLPEAPREVNRYNPRIHHALEERPSTASLSRCAGITSRRKADDHSQTTLAQSAENEDVLQALLRCLRIDHVRLFTANSAQTIGSRHDLDVLPAAQVLTLNGDQALLPRTLHSIQDMTAVFAALLAFLKLNTGTHHTETTASVAPQGRQNMAMLGALFAFALARYLCLPAIGRALSELSGDSITLQDPFGVERRVPLTHCENFIMLKAYLKVRLSGTVAETFVDNNQFNLTMGKRNGPAVRRSDWSKMGRIKKHSRVVMAVYLRKNNAECSFCHQLMTMSVDGHFSW